MNKTALLAAIVIVFARSAIASEPVKVKAMDDVTYVIPSNSPVGQATVKEYDVVEYVGRIMVTGKYEYGYATDDPAETDSYGEKYLNFFLDKKSIESLPYWERDGQIASELVVNNPEEFARAVISKKQLVRLEGKKIMSIRGNASIWIEHFQTHVECDHQYDSADFSSVVEKDYVTNQSFAEPAGC